MRVFPTIYPIRYGVTCRRLYFYLNNLQRGDSAVEFDGSLDAAAYTDFQVKMAHTKVEAR